MLSPEKLLELKNSQEERLNLSRSFFVDSWDSEIEIIKIKPNDMVKSEQAALISDDNGSKSISDEVRKAVIVLLGVKGLNPLRDKEFILNEPAGVINDIFREIMDFSGFGSSLEEVIKEKKKV